MILRSIILEDDKLARIALERLCVNHKSLNHIKSFERASDALLFLEENEIDLIWLDVEMDEMNGFDFLNKLAVLPLVIMTTASTEYAYEAFQYDILDYIHKPITKPRLNMAIEKVLANRKSLEQVITTAPIDKSLDSENIYVKIDRKFIRIKKSEVSYIENFGDYVKIFTELDTFVVLTQLKVIEKKLGPAFFRVHRSYIINLNKILDVDENNLVIKNKVIPISRRQKSEFLRLLNIL